MQYRSAVAHDEMPILSIATHRNANAWSMNRPFTAIGYCVASHRNGGV